MTKAYSQHCTGAGFGIKVTNRFFIDCDFRNVIIQSNYKQPNAVSTTHIAFTNSLCYNPEYKPVAKFKFKPKQINNEQKIS